MFKNKTIKLFLTLGVILFSLIGVVGCSNLSSNSNESEITNSRKEIFAIYEGPYFEMNFENKFDIINSVDDLKMLLKKDISDDYSNLFFEEKALIAFTYSESSSGNRSIIDSYKVENDNILIDIQTIKFGEDCAMGYWWFFLELNKDTLDNIKKVKIINNNIIINYSRMTSLEKYIMQFDIDDEQFVWYGDTADIVSFDRIHINLKRTNTYPEFKLEYLGIKEAVSFEYIGDQFPPDYYFKEEYKYLLDKFRQSVIVYLEPQTLDKLIEIIKEIESLPFVRDVSPNVSVELC